MPYKFSCMALLVFIIQYNLAIIFHYSLPIITDKIPAAITGPTGMPPKNITPIIVPTINPVNNSGCAPISSTPRPPNHATKIPTAIAKNIFQLRNSCQYGRAILPDTRGLNTPIVRIMIPIFKPYFSINGMYLKRNVCCINNKTIAEINTLVLLLMTPNKINTTNSSDTELNCMSIT